MGFFSDILSGIGGVVTQVAPILGALTGAGGLAGLAGAVLAPAGKAASALAAPAVGTTALTPAGAAAVAAAGGRQALLATAPGVGAPASAQLGFTAAQVAAGIGQDGTSGNANVRIQTLVQRIDRMSNTVISQTVLRGRPFLMNGEVRALKRVAKLIGKAHQKLPRRATQMSQKALNDAVTQRIQELSQAGHLLAPHGKVC